MSRADGISAAPATFRMARIARGFAAAFCAALPFLTLTSQPRPARGVIDGVVTDTNLVPLPGAIASVMGTEVKVVIGANGRFRISALPAGEYILAVRHVGYSPLLSLVTLTGGDTLRPSYSLERLVTLDPAVITAKPPVAVRLQEFEDRRRLGFGHFMSQDEIDAKGRSFAADLIRSFSSVVSVHSDRAGQFAMSVRAGCAFQIFLDGMPQPTPTNLDILPRPIDLGGIEIYSGPATIPPQYKSLNGAAKCGVILIWTR
jgi:hypothetical protein